MNSRFKFKGFYHVEHIRDGKVIGEQNVKNGIVDEGLDAVLDIMFHGSTQLTTWYLGLIDNAGFSALADSDVMASHAGWSESVAYSDATRIEWSEDAASGQSITNSTPDTFNINASATIYGIFVTSGSAKSGTVGTLWSTAAFTSPIAVSNGDQLKITYTLTAATS